MLAALRPDTVLGAEALAALRLATCTRGLARGGARVALPSAVAMAARQATDGQTHTRLCAVLAQEEAPWELKLRADTARARQLARGWRDDGACIPAALDVAAARSGGGEAAAAARGTSAGEWELLDLVVAAHGVAPLRYRLPARDAVYVGALLCDAAAEGAPPDGGTSPARCRSASHAAAWVRLGGHGMRPHHATLQSHERGVAVLPVDGLLFANGEPVLQRTELAEGDTVVFGSECVLQLCRAASEVEAEAASVAASRRVAATASLQGASFLPPRTVPPLPLTAPYHPPRSELAAAPMYGPAAARAASLPPRGPAPTHHLQDRAAGSGAMAFISQRARCCRLARCAGEGCTEGR